MRDAAERSRENTNDEKREAVTKREANSGCGDTKQRWKNKPSVSFYQQISLPFSLLAFKSNKK